MSIRTSGRNAHNQTLTSLVALLCILLILFVGVAQVLHTHAAAETANPACSLCAVAHVSVLPAPLLSTQVAAAIARTGPPRETVAAPAARLSFALYVRPPPARTAHS